MTNELKEFMVWDMQGLMQTALHKLLIGMTLLVIYYSTWHKM